MATSKKPQTNESRLKKLIADNPPILNDILVERILKIMEITEKDIKENPQNWVRAIIHPSWMHHLNENVQTHLNS